MVAASPVAHLCINAEVINSSMSQIIDMLRESVCVQNKFPRVSTSFAVQRFFNIKMYRKQKCGSFVPQM